MSLRIRIIITLLGLALFSAIAVNWLASEKSLFSEGAAHHPDYFMEQFSTLTMEVDGTPKNKLIASYMAHYEDDDTIELTRPRLEIYKPQKPPMIITADKGWVTADTKVILLAGRVDLWQDNHDGIRELEVITADVRVLLDQDYAETDQHATIKSFRSVVNTDGLRAYFKKNRIELLDNVHGKLEPKAPG